MSLTHAQRVRVHLIDPPGGKLPSIEGLLKSRRRHEYLIAVPQLLISEGGVPVEPEGRYVEIPRERVLMLEHL